MAMTGWAGVGMAIVAGLGGFSVGMGAQSTGVAPSTMPRIGTVDERFQSFNVEMLEVTGGRFWAPYKAAKAADGRPQGPTVPMPTPAGMDPSLFRYRSPIDLGNARLRKLAAALGPSYMRVSGTWANSTYFQDTDGPAMKTPPDGFGGVLTRRQWKGVVDFSKAVDAKLVTSFAISPGVRGADGVWTPVEAKKFLGYTKATGGSIAAAEMFNEPTFASMGGAPKGYNAVTYGRDFKAFRAYMKEAAPEVKILGPGSVGEGTPLAADMPGVTMLKSVDLLENEGPGPDVFSYHFYGGVSKRCVGPGTVGQTTPETALSDAWLGRTERDEEFYAKLREKYLPGGELWLTETGETACGGNPWAATFIDSFRYLNQLGVLAKRGVQVVIHNTLAASDYALIEEETLQPRPNYWAALLWRRLMGTGVLDPGPSRESDLHVYAHCLRGVPGGVAILVINADPSAARSFQVSVEAERYTLTAKDLMGSGVDLNGRPLILGANDTLPKLEGKATPAGSVEFQPASITFLAVERAGNAGCRR